MIERVMNKRNKKKTMQKTQIAAKHEKNKHVVLLSRLFAEFRVFCVVFFVFLLCLKVFIIFISVITSLPPIQTFRSDTNFET